MVLEPQMVLLQAFAPKETSRSFPKEVGPTRLRDPSIHGARADRGGKSSSPSTKPPGSRLLDLYSGAIPPAQGRCKIKEKQGREAWRIRV